jgi:hypothetical protein
LKTERGWQDFEHVAAASITAVFVTSLTDVPAYFRSWVLKAFQTVANWHSNFPNG